MTKEELMRQYFLDPDVKWDPEMDKEWAILQRSKGHHRKEKRESIAAEMVDALLEGLSPEQCIDAMINVPVRRFHGVDRRRLAGFEEGEVISLRTHPKYKKEQIPIGPGYVRGAKIPAKVTLGSIERANLPIEVKKGMLKKQLKRVKALDKLHAIAKRAEQVRKISGEEPPSPEKSIAWQAKVGKKMQTAVWRRKPKPSSKSDKAAGEKVAEGIMNEQNPMQQTGMSQQDAAKAVDTELMKRQAERRKQADQKRREQEQQRMQRRSEQEKAKQQAAQQAQNEIVQKRKQREQEQQKQQEQQKKEMEKAKEERAKAQKAAVKPVKEEKLPQRRLMPAYFYRYAKSPAGSGEGENVTFPGKAGPGV